MNVLNLDYNLSEIDVANYKRTGFLLMKNIFAQDFIDYLKIKVKEQLESPTDSYQKGFDKLRYDLCNDDEVILDLIGQKKFKEIMSQLHSCNLFFTQGVGFGLKKKVSKGFTWHIESQSFGFNRSEDFSTTLWIPLDRINKKDQRGGMRYVPRDVISGEFMYDFIDPAVFRCMEEKISNGGIEFDDYVKLRDEPLNSSGIERLLEYFSTEDDFELGDALIFDKYVIHRSVPLDDGDLDSRDAFSLRFIDTSSRYDLKRAHSIEIPRNYYKYEGPTKFHLEICKEDDSLIVESKYFDGDREKRFMNLL